MKINKRISKKYTMFLTISYASFFLTEKEIIIM